MSRLLGRKLTPEEEAAKPEIQKELRRAGSDAAAARAVSALAERQRDSFFGAAISLLEAEAQPSELREALLCSPELLAGLCDPERLSRGQAISACRTLMEMDPRLDVRLAELAPRPGRGACRLDTASTLRLLEILDEVSAGSRLVFVFNELAFHSNVKIASKAALLAARRVRNPAWVQEHMSSNDARTRANIVEALWGNRAAWAQSVVREALGDENNRVAGNALMALHFLGSPDFTRLAMRMLHDERPAFRGTAAWAMGRSGDPAFLETLRQALSDPSPEVRCSSTRALIAIRRPMAQRETAAAGGHAAAQTPAGRESCTNNLPAAEACRAAELSPG